MVAGTSRADMSKLRREAVMQATSSLLDEVGISALTIRQVADRAGVAPGTIFLYADNKTDLVNQVYGQRISAKWHALLDGLGNDPHLARVETFYLQCVDLFYGDLTNIRAFYAEMSAKPTVRQGSADRLLERLHHELVEAKSNGELRDDVDVNVLAVSYQGLYSNVIGLADNDIGHEEARLIVAESLKYLRRGVAASDRDAPAR